MTLARMGADARAAVPTLCGALQSGNEARRYAAMRALGGIGTDADAAVPRLLGILNRYDRRTVAKEAAVALGRIGARPEQVVPALIEALRKSPLNKVFVAQALGEFGRHALKAEPFLRQYLGDDDRALRGAAGEALSKIAADLYQIPLYQ